MLYIIVCGRGIVSTQLCIFFILQNKHGSGFFYIHLSWIPIFTMRSEFHISNENLISRLT